MAVWFRRAVQAVFLLLFLFLFIQTEQKGADALGYPAKIFLDFDPLLALASFLSGHALPAAMLLSLTVVAATVLFGRVFCGWVCPFGTLHNLVGALKRSKAPRRVLGWFRAKYLLLTFLLGASLVGVQLTGVFDPISLLIRHLTLGVYPAFNHAMNGAVFLVFSSGVGLLAKFALWAHGALKSTVLAFQQPYFHQGALMTALLLGILLLNLSEKRLWCRYLCPLGALLGFLGRWAPFKRFVSEGCNRCGVCDGGCQGGSVKGGLADAECVRCMTCGGACPREAVSFGFSAKPAGGAVSLGRRDVLLAGGAGLATVAVSRSAPAFDPNRPNPALIRPPGALPEPEFLARCIKCGECMKVCTTNGLQPTFLEAGLEGIWSPVLKPERGYCEFNCTLCGQVCPTGAIRRLTPEEKRAWRIGTAMFERSRCLPLAHYKECIVCEEHCPTPKKAIWFLERASKDRDGNEVMVKQPRVDFRLCVGCGICVAKCPLVDAPGIRVTSIGETRSKNNRILLQDGPGSDAYGF